MPICLPPLFSLNPLLRIFINPFKAIMAFIIDLFDPLFHCVRSGLDFWSNSKRENLSLRTITSVIGRKQPADRGFRRGVRSNRRQIHRGRMKVRLPKSTHTKHKKCPSTHLLVHEYEISLMNLHYSRNFEWAHPATGFSFTKNFGQRFGERSLLELVVHFLVNSGSIFL